MLVPQSNGPSRAIERNSILIEFLAAHATSIQPALFGLTIVACFVFEDRLLSHDRERTFRRAWTNGSFAALVLPVQAVMAIFCLFLARWASARHWGLVHWLPGGDSPWIKYGLMFVLLDFLDWVYHYAMHRVPLFWRFHLVHHTDQAIDVSTTVREHPGETVVRNGFLMLWVLLCGASMEVLVLRQTVETVANILAHTSFRLNARSARVLGWVLITPNLHHVHHHARLPYTNSNYGDVFSIWDRLFRTFRNLSEADTEAGLDTHPSAGSDHGFRQALAMPFVTRRS